MYDLPRTRFPDPRIKGGLLMVFSSLVFLLFFLPALILVYYLVPARFRGLRNLILLGASLFFYWWGAVRWSF